ncbi:hypothetical protein EI42_04289 [Thermosporothrix hazakensis]|jgi:hypothetical protein|uniref:Uncharacterized protein n=2 Tax=Thermosporothrix TaxID=768650 RepID=A0A326UFA7_THEHA|nr:hypothetical protein [Thermosporothrix hazakensis]PZW25445.1 hypothetical protein EI42_04289 [Thermosporothrix hazakensis]BBH90781.1 hypothetical protein KTC_55320 [Thermosporothrix sp. COM3]GCE48831.1 hypothetical protein KTH_37000 [Thermosporothrix hazakensis]
MNNNGRLSNRLLLAGVALGVTTALTAVTGYVRKEIRRRGYPSWNECRCDFKEKHSFYQVWNSKHQRQGETIVTHEWGTYLVDPSPWMRRFLHYGAQVLATLNPRHRYVERLTLSPQEAQRFAMLLHTAAVPTNEETPSTNESGKLVWRREILHVPRHFFDTFTRRLYPVPVPQEREHEATELPVLWDAHEDLPLTTEGTLLETPIGTRIDYIGWTPSQISYCTARLGRKE